MIGEGEPTVIVPEAVEPEKYNHEKGNNGQEDNEQGNPIHNNILSIQSWTNPN